MGLLSHAVKVQSYLQCMQTATRRCTLPAVYDCAVAEHFHVDAYAGNQVAIWCWLMRGCVYVRPGSCQIWASEKLQTIGASNCHTVRVSQLMLEKEILH